ncbi:unnamed protein product, partial [Didymodactylos carnosus]
VLSTDFKNGEFIRESLVEKGQTYTVQVTAYVAGKLTANFMFSHFTPPPTMLLILPDSEITVQSRSYKGTVLQDSTTNARIPFEEIDRSTTETECINIKQEKLSSVVLAIINDPSSSSSSSPPPSPPPSQPTKPDKTTANNHFQFLYEKLRKAIAEKRKSSPHQYYPGKFHYLGYDWNSDCNINNQHKREDDDAHDVMCIVENEFAD